MKTAYVVVEGPKDAEILRAVLDPKLHVNVVVVPAGGLAYVSSLARSLLVRRSDPVAVFVDADSLDQDSISDRRTQLKELINSVAGRTTTEVIVAVPEIEAIFFTAPEVMKRMFGRIQPELLALGSRDPKGVLDQLASMSQTEWSSQKVLGMMSPHELEQHRRAQPIKEITKFLEKVQNTTKLTQPM
jgi:hypothetical protein